MKYLHFFTLFFTILCHHALFAQGVKGTITDAETKQGLAYASIYIKETGTGTTSNEHGYYEIQLPAGRYEIVFQFLGFETTSRIVTINDEFVSLDVILKPQATILPTFTVDGNNEDPAYTIMRKTIAKAKFHTQQLDHYTAKVYIKGTGKIIDYPWIAKKQIEKEGIKKGQVFVSESISKITYTRPNKFEEQVISIRSDGDNNGSSPNQYIFGSFYEPEIAETISPLSPKAFSYYKFEYLGSFRDRDYEISTIKVIPRSKGDNVVDGVINIVEDWWSIHSLDLNTYKMGIRFHMKSMFAPIQDKAWMPVTHQFHVDGKVLGFEFNYKYLASVSDYTITLNPALIIAPQQMDIIDEKVDKEEAKKVTNAQKQNTKKKNNTKDLQERLESGKEITRKELNKLLNTYEKEENKKKEEPSVISEVVHKVDSGAHVSDSLFWINNRPIPLSDEEVIGYKKMDSLAVVEKKIQEGDTLKSSKHKGFQPWDLLLGDSYSFKNRTNLQIHFPMIGFNTVEGYNLVYKLTLGKQWSSPTKPSLSISPMIRYAFSRESLSGQLKTTFKDKSNRIDLTTGRYIGQYNADEPILPIVNSFTTLLLERNLMKIYEHDFMDLRYNRNVNDKYSFQVQGYFGKRYELENNSTHTWINRKSIEYTPNRPSNDELSSTEFPTHNALIGQVQFKATPWIRYTIRNGFKSEVPESSPTFTLTYKKGFASVFNSEVDFDHLNLKVNHAFNVGIRGKVFYNVSAGYFPNAKHLHFMDYQHFIGNRTPIMTTNPSESFRLLDYYQYSTADRYVALNAFYQFRKFLITRIPMVRMTGIKESVFVNYLATPTSENYTEVGYAIENIVRLFRLEVATNFNQGKFNDVGFRIGLSSYITLRFND
jgi:hypothetical protein